MPSRHSRWTTLRIVRRFLSQKLAVASYRFYWQLDSFIRFFGGAIYYDIRIQENENCKPDPYLHLWCLATTLVFNYFNSIRYVLSWFCTTPESQKGIHDFATVIGGAKEFHLICFTIWSIHNVIISITWYKTLTKDDTLVLEPLMAIKYPWMARK